MRQTLRNTVVIALLTAALSDVANAAPLTVRDATAQLRDVVVQGTVYAQIGGRRSALPGASVELEQPNADAQHRVAASVVTDSAGHFAITNPSKKEGATYYDVSPGTYNLFVSYRTKRVAFGTIAASPDRSITKNPDLGVVTKSGGAAPPTPSPVFYVTDRTRDPNGTGIQIFENTRLIDPCNGGVACMMSYGKAVPSGPFLSPSPAPDVANLVSAIRSTPRYASAQTVLVFVHGYNNDFAGPLEIGATWLSSLDPADPVIVYSWPSNHQLPKYIDDETNNTWDQVHFRDFMLALMADPSAPKTVNIFAHSMGNRIALSFLDFLASAKPSLSSHIGQVIFAAPDVDSATFFEAVPRIAAVAQGLTMYGSNHDNALRGSRFLHGHCRAGLVGCDYAVPDVSNFNAIDASMFHCDFLGHGYWLSSDTLRADIATVLKSGVMAGGTVRPNIKAGTVRSSYVFDAAFPSDRSCQAEAADSS